MRLIIGEILALVCPTCDLSTCPCDVERPVAFVRGVCAVPSLRSRRTRLSQFTRPGAGRHRRPPRIGVFAR